MGAWGGIQVMVVVVVVVVVIAKMNGVQTLLKKNDD